MDSDSPVPFGYKIGWFAIQSTDRDAVVRALQLSDPREITWKAGIDTVYKDAYNLLKTPLRLRSTIFVSPAVGDWTFVVGDWTVGTGHEQGVREVEQLIARVSAEFGEAQAFATYRVVEYHHWMLARNGALV